MNRAVLVTIFAASVVLGGAACGGANPTATAATTAPSTARTGTCSQCRPAAVRQPMRTRPANSCVATAFRARSSRASAGVRSAATLGSAAAANSVSAKDK